MQRLEKLEQTVYVELLEEEEEEEEEEEIRPLCGHEVLTWDCPSCFESVQGVKNKRIWG